VSCIYANKDTGIYSSYVRRGVFSGVLQSENLTSNALTQNTRTRLAVIDKLTKHFGTKTVQHQYRMVPKCLETLRHQIFTGAKVSGHFGTSAKIPRDTSAPSVKNRYMGYCFFRIGLLLLLYAESKPKCANPTTSPAVSNRQNINLMRSGNLMQSLSIFLEVV